MHCVQLICLIRFSIINSKGIVKIFPVLMNRADLQLLVVTLWYLFGKAQMPSVLLSECRPLIHCLINVLFIPKYVRPLKIISGKRSLVILPDTAVFAVTVSLIFFRVPREKGSLN